MLTEGLTIGAIMKCVKGESWPTQSFQSFVDTSGADTSGDLTEQSIYFICPVSHRFTLAEALSKNIFSQEQAKKIMETACRLFEEYEEKKKQYFPSDYLPDKEVEGSNLPCDGCGKRAQRGWVRKSLCLECCAAFDNYFEKYEYDAREVMYRTWGKPKDIFWEKIFYRFLGNLPPLSAQEMKVLLEQCRREARRTRTESKRS